MSTIEVGSKLQGKVTGITNFGAFVELPGGKTGLVHISEVADNYVKDVNDHLKIGDMVEVKVLSEKEGKLALSIKQTVDRPERPERPERASFSKPRPRPTNGRGNDRSKGNFKPKETFEDKISQFLKSSEESLSTIKRNAEGKRGGRGGRRG